MFIDLKGKERHPIITLSEPPLALGKHHLIDRSYFNDAHRFTHLFLFLYSSELSILILSFEVFLGSEKHG
jgi:hypothetical protein